MSLFTSLRQWKPRHLLAAWSAYWAALVVVALGPAIVAVLRVTLPANGKGSVSAGFGDGSLTAIVTNGGATVWSGSASALAVASAIALPPLVLWLVWMVRQDGSQLAARDQDLLPHERAERVSVGRSSPSMVERADASKDADARNAPPHA